MNILNSLDGKKVKLGEKFRIQNDLSYKFVNLVDIKTKFNKATVTVYDEKNKCYSKLTSLITFTHPGYLFKRLILLNFNK